MQLKWCFHKLQNFHENWVIVLKTLIVIIQRAFYIDDDPATLLEIPCKLHMNSTAVNYCDRTDRQNWQIRKATTLFLIHKLKPESSNKPVNVLLNYSKNLNLHSCSLPEFDQILPCSTKAVLAFRRCFVWGLISPLQNLQQASLLLWVLLLSCTVKLLLGTDTGTQEWKR